MAAHALGYAAASRMGVSIARLSRVGQRCIAGRTECRKPMWLVVDSTGRAELAQSGRQNHGRWRQHIQPRSKYPPLQLVQVASRMSVSQRCKRRPAWLRRIFPLHRAAGRMLSEAHTIYSFRQPPLYRGASRSMLSAGTCVYRGCVRS